LELLSNPGEPYRDAWACSEARALADAWACYCTEGEVVAFPVKVPQAA